MSDVFLSTFKEFAYPIRMRVELSLVDINQTGAFVLLKVVDQTLLKLAICYLLTVNKTIFLYSFFQYLNDLLFAPFHVKVESIEDVT